MTSDDARISEIRRRHQEGPFGECETCDVLARFEALASQQQERLDALAAEREEIDAAVRELHEAALEKLEGRVTYWMGQRDKFCDQLADEKKSHARTQEWLDKFQSEAATQQVRAIMAEQALTKAEAERDAAVARAERAESALEVAEQVIADVQFDLINCHSQNACAHIQDALNIVNRHCAALAAASEDGAGSEMVWNGANYPQELPPDVDEWDCSVTGHEWQLTTRHADPPGYRGVLPNAICPHCSEQTWIDLEAETGDRE